MNILLLSFILIMVSSTASEQPGCVNAIGQPVSWWVILKVPPMIGVSGYGYYDSNSFSGQFEYVNKSVDLTVSPLTQTLGQINHEQLDRIAWNDEKPNNQTSSSKAHSKGIIAYSRLSNRGFYIVHSIPKYPAFL